MITAIGNAFSTMISWVGTFVTALVSPVADGPDISSLLPLFAIGIAVSLVMVCMKIVRKITWGS